MRKLSGGFFSSLYRVLLLIFFVLIIVIIAVTLWAFITKQSVPGAGLRRRDPDPQEVLRMVQKEKPAQNAVLFSEIGQLRLVTADPQPLTIILTPFFPYNGSDTAFQEELMYKTRSMRTIIQEYFAQSLQSNLKERGENAVKEDLITALNAELVLGSISNLYFSEYMFLE